MSLESIQNSINPIITKVSSFLSTNTPNYLKNGEAQTVALEQLGKFTEFVSKNTPESIKNSKAPAFILSNLKRIPSEFAKHSPKIIAENPVYASGIALLSLTAIRTVYLQVKSYIAKSKTQAALKTERLGLEKDLKTVDTSTLLGSFNSAKSYSNMLRYAEMCMTGQGGKVDFAEAEASLSKVPVNFLDATDLTIQLAVLKLASAAAKR
jgi:hypothetical protein